VHSRSATYAKSLLIAHFGLLIESPPNQHSATRNQQCLSVSVEGFEPSTSCAQGTRTAKLCYTLIELLPEGIEPIILRMKAGNPYR
jgi:hypothetical protein